MKFIYFLLLMLIFSCESKKPQPAYTISIGDEIKFEVISDPSSPYFWEWTNEKNVKIVRLKSRVFKNKINEGRIGHGGVETWVFQARNKGVDTLRLQHRSYPEDIFNRKIARKLKIEVTVE